MAKTVAELQEEYARLTEENRKAYDALKGTGPQGGLEQKYLRLKDKLNKPGAFKEQIQKDIDAIEPKFKAAQAKYKETQTAKNAAKRELQAAQAAEKEAKEKGVKEKSAKSVYDKALAEFKDAEVKLGGYKGQEGYVTAYQKLQAAREEFVKAGGNPPTLPAPKVSIPKPEGQKGAETGAEGGTVDITSYSDALNYLTDPAHKEELIQAQKALTKFGYKGNIKGEPDLGFTQALENAAKQYAGLPEGWRGGSLLDYIVNPLGGAGAGAGGVGGGPEVSLYPEITNEQDGRITINKFFQDKFGRDATDAEFKAAYNDIIKQQKAKPRKQTITRNAKGEKVISYTGGTNTEQILSDWVAKKPKLQSEADTYEASDANVLKREKEKELYDRELAKLGGDPEKIAALNASTSYGRSIQSMQNKIARIALEAGAQFGAEELAKYAKEAIDTSLDKDTESLTAFINDKLKFGKGMSGRYTGVAGTNVDALNKVAAANGIDLEKAFGAQLPDWLANINKGESIETYKKIIRDVAKIGMPEKVAKLIDQGVDLSAIYAPYKNLMASTLEINPQTIDMNDPTLRSAITADAEVPLYEFERALRKDNRWQYTNQAKEEVSSATRKILQDFGFMG